MAATDELFQLIRSLTPSEKRYFKIHAKTHIGDKYKNSYEKLFDALNYWAEEEYDEQQFKRKHKGKSFIKNLSVEKNYLYELIMVTMRSYHTENILETRLYQLTADLRLLYDKGLHEQGKKLVQQAYKLAETREQLPLMIYLCHFKDRFARYRQTEEEMALASTNFEVEKKLLKALEGERTIAHLRREIFNLYITGKLKAITASIRPRLIEWESTYSGTNLTRAARRSFITCNALIAEKEGSYQLAMEWYEQLIALAETELQFNKEPVEYFRVLLSNYLVCAHHCERYDLFDDIIRKIEQQPSQSIRDKSEVFVHTYQYKLLRLLNSDSHNDGHDLILEIETGLARYKSLISPKTEINFRMNICIFFLNSREFERLIKALNNAYNLLGRDIKYKPLMRDLKLMELMANTSLCNWDLLNFQITNTERWLREHSLQNNFTASALAFFKKCVSQNISPKNNIKTLSSSDCPAEMLMTRELMLKWIG